MEDVPDLFCTFKYVQHTVAPGTLANLARHKLLPLHLIFGPPWLCDEDELHS